MISSSIGAYMRTTILSLVAASSLVALAAAQRAPTRWSRREIFDTSGLGLSADQETKLQGIVEQLRQANVPVRARLDQILGGRRFRDIPPAEQDSLRPQMEPIRLEMLENRRTALDQIDAILTPAQRRIVDQRAREHQAAPSERPPSKQPPS